MHVGTNARRVKSWCQVQFNDLRSRFGSDLGFVLLPWLVPACTALVDKYWILISGGFMECAAQIAPGKSLSLAEQASLFRFDLLIAFGLIPLALAIVTRPMPRYGRIALSGLLAVVVQFLLNLEFGIYKVTGAFSSAQNAWYIAKWSIVSHDTSLVTIPTSEKTALLGAFATIAGCIAVSLVASARGVRWIGRVAVEVCCVGVLLGMLLSTPHVQATSWTPSLFSVTGRAMLEEDSDLELREKSSLELIQHYRMDAHVPEPANADPYFGAAANYNVVFFIVESTPVWIVDPATDLLDDLPNLRKLKEQSFVSRQHYTTYPLTNYAMFSLFTSMYTKIIPGREIGDRGVQVPSLIRNVRAAGYRTGFYGFVWKDESQRDDRMLSGIGFEKVVEPRLDSKVDRNGSQTFTGPVEYVEGHDREVLGSMLNDVREWTSNKQKFVAAFAPEIGHDPWREVKNCKASFPAARARALLVQQDEWLGEIVKALKRGGVLDKTIIVVVSDHGVRLIDSGHEDREVVGQARLDERTLRVPMMIAVPRVLSHTVMLAGPTSHIDVAPTIHSLLGMRAHRELEQGSVIWQPHLEARRLYLDTFGAEGFIQDGRISVVKFTRAVSRDSNMESASKNILPIDSGDAKEISTVIRMQSAMQRALVHHVLKGLP